MLFPTSRKLVLPIVAFLTLVAPHAPGLAAPKQKPVTPLSSQAQKEIQEQQKKIERMKEGMKEQKERIEESRREEDSLIKELDGIEARLRKGKSRLEELNVTVENQEERIRKKEAEYRKVRKEKDASRGHIEKRLAAYYRMDPLGVVSIVFAAETLPELLAVNDYLDAMVRADRQAISGYRDRMTALAREKEQLQAEKDRFLRIMEEVTKQENELAATRKGRATLLAKVNTEKRLYQRALDEIEEAAGRLTRKMEEFRSVEEQKAREAERTARAEAKREKTQAPEKSASPAAATGSFAARKGSLAPPVAGAVVRRFGENRDNKFGITTYASGIGIKAAAGAEIRAIHSGRVAYAGVLKGYGNLLIIDHGDQYYSLVARLESFTRKEGDRVQEGDAIGTVGEQGGILDDGIHFEIRHGTKPEDPLQWVRKAGLKF